MREVVKRLAIEAAWAPLAVLVAHTVAGAIFGHEPFVDPISHFLGGVAACFFFRRSAEIGGPVLGVMTPMARDLFSFGLTCTLAVLWEIGEFAGDQLFRGNAQRGLNNTMRDLILGMTGAIVFLSVRRSVEFIRAAGLREKGA